MEFVVGLLDDFLDGCAPTLLWDFEFHTRFLDWPLLSLWEWWVVLTVRKASVYLRSFGHTFWFWD